jgi:hypothetical protein
VKKVSDIVNKLKLLFEEYEKSLNEFGVRPAPLSADLGLPEFMDWVEAIQGASRCYLWC